MPRSAYERSKGVERVTWREFPLGKGIALSILDETTATGRQVNGQTLLDVLDEAAGLPPCKLTVPDRPSGGCRRRRPPRTSPSRPPACAPVASRHRSGSVIRCSRSSATRVVARGKTRTLQYGGRSTAPQTGRERK